MAGSSDICSVCQLKTVKNCHYGAYVCKNCAQMFKRNFFRQDLVCRNDQRNCRSGSTHPCPKCRLDRCFQAGMKTGLISVHNGNKVYRTENYEMIREMVRLYDMIKDRIIDRRAMNQQLVEYDGLLINIFLNPMQQFPDISLTIASLFQQAPVFSSMCKDALNRFVDNFFFYYIILIHTWSIMNPRRFQVYYANNYLLFLTPSIYVNFAKADITELSNEDLDRIVSGVRECSSIAMEHSNAWTPIEWSTVFLYALVKVGRRNSDRIEALNRIAQMEVNITNEFGCYSGNNIRVLNGIEHFVDELDKTVRYFEAVTVRVKHRLPKPVSQKPTFAINPAMTKIPFYFDGYAAIDIPSQFSAFRQYAP